MSPNTNTTQSTSNLLMAIVSDISTELATRDSICTGLEQLMRLLENDITQLQNITSVIQRPNTIEDFTDPYEHAVVYIDQHVKPNLGMLNQAVQETNFYHKYKHVWKMQLQTLVFTAMYVRWMGNNGLPSPDALSQVLGIPFETDDRIVGSDGSIALHFSVEDYLHAVVDFSNELSRLTVSLVTHHMMCRQRPDYEITESSLKYILDSIQEAANEAQRLFLSLNLKNDSLRKRGDSIKYDTKKIQEVVYDLAIRGVLR